MLVGRQLREALLEQVERADLVTGGLRGDRCGEGDLGPPTGGTADPAEGCLVEAKGVPCPSDAKGLVPGLDRRGGGGLGVPGRGGVPGQIGGGTAVGVGLEGREPGLVQPSAGAGQQLGGDALPEERVAEAEVPLTGPLEDLVVDRLLEGVVERLCVEVGHVREEVRVDGAARERGRAHEETGRVVEAVQAQAEQSVEVLRSRGAVAPRDDLLGKEGVPAGPVDDLGDAGGGDRGVVEVAHEPVHLLGRQGREVDPGHERQPSPDGEHLVQRVAPVEVVAAVGDDEGDGRAEAAREQDGEQVPGAVVGPVHVLDDDHERTLPGRGGEQRVDALGDLARVGRRTRRGGRRMEDGQPGVLLEQLVEGRGVPGQPADELDEGEPGQGLPADPDAVAGDDETTGLAGLGGQLGDEPGLADAGVAAHEDRPAGRARAELAAAAQAVQLCGTPDERAGARGEGHALDHGRGWSRRRRHACRARGA